MQKLSFYKMTGSGNDFIIIDNRDGKVDLTEFRPVIPRICRRGLSVGADGVIMIEDSDRAHFRWRFYNADGSEPEMCGNGGRCVARLAYLLGIAPEELSFETAVGIIRASVHGRVVKLAVPPPKDIRIGITVSAGGQEMTVDFIDTGVPHAVIQVPELDQIDVVSLGRELRFHPAFQPNGTNVDFIVVHDGNVDIRTYERGVEDETLACGTGVMAAALAAHFRGLATSPTEVVTRGGEHLKVYYAGGSQITELYFEGAVSLVYEGRLWEESFV